MVAFGDRHDLNFPFASRSAGTLPAVGDHRNKAVGTSFALNVGLAACSSLSAALMVNALIGEEERT
jgi:hypothetical protein